MEGSVLRNLCNDHPTSMNLHKGAAYFALLQVSLGTNFEDLHKLTEGAELNLRPLQVLVSS